MNKFLAADEKYRKQMIEHVRESLNLPPQSIEKDLWDELMQAMKGLQERVRKKSILHTR